MRNRLLRTKPIGMDEHLSGPLSPTQTAQMEEEERKAQTEIEKWAWGVHEVAQHEAAQREREAFPPFGGKEPLLKKVSEEVTRKAQEKIKQAAAKRSSS